ncbi:MAG TPA: TonB-dependent receptor [Phnomibacter sp.]|nr:TonB-dependent receptor [Phnomibacter sp.]
MRAKLLARTVLVVLFSFLLFTQSNGQSITVSGKVLNREGQPLQGVSISVKGTTTMVVSGADGGFSIAAPNNTATLVFTYIGFAEQEVALNGRSSVNISMQPKDNALTDVVVVGYGTQKKTDITGALSRITAKDITERPTQNVLQALQGKAAGVQVSSNNKPGELPVVRVRGNRSIGASNDPLYVVDGIPIIDALGVSSFSVSDINPNDIVSMEILKDASATAIYGSRGANGVVLITTTRAKTGKTSLSYTGSVSLDSYKSLTDWMSGGEYIDRWRFSLMNGRIYQPTTNTNFNNPATISYPDPFLDRDKMSLAADKNALASVWAGYDWVQYGVTPKMRQTTADEQAMGWPAQVPVYNSNNIRTYDWMDAATRQGITNNHNISLTGGTQNAHVALSLGYFNQKGVQSDQDYNRYNASISGDISPTKWLTLGTSIISSFSIQNFGIMPPNTSNTGAKDLYSRATEQFPYAVPRDSAGAWIYNPGGNLSLWNPLIDIDQSLNERRSTSVLANVFAEVKFTPWLKYRVNFGPQYRQYRAGTWTGPNATSHLTNRPNTASYNTQENFSWVVENLLFLDKDFGKNHRLGVTLLQSSQQSRRENSGTSVSGLINPLSLWYDLASNTTGNPGYGTGYTENSLASFMGRVNYTLMNRFLFTFTGRADGSSVLAPEHKWQFFPSAALAWKMQDEGFLSNVSWIDELKPRVSWGVTGNSSVQPYTTSGPLSRNPYMFGSAAAIGYLPQLVQNPDLKWESTEQTNFGLDFRFLNSRIGGSLELYSQKTSDLIFAKNLPAVSGYVQKYENIGKTSNKGVEITLSTVPVRTKDFTWNLDINWSRNKEEITELVNGKEDMVANGLFIGQPTQIFRQYANAGVWTNDSKEITEMAKFNANGHKFYPGTVRVVDQNGDYKIDGNDLVILGSPRPKWTGGITNTFTYKGFSLNSFIYMRWGQTYFGGFPGAAAGSNPPNGRVENDYWYWNKSGRWPMPNAGNVENITSAMQYNDGSFIAVRNISLSYQFPGNWVKKISAQGITLNVQVLNPFIFGPKNSVVNWGINPDDDTNWSIASGNTNPLGGTNNNTIVPRSVVFGVRANF